MELRTIDRLAQDSPGRFARQAIFGRGGDENDRDSAEPLLDHGDGMGAIAFEQFDVRRYQARPMIDGGGDRSGFRIREGERRDTFRLQHRLQIDSKEWLVLDNQHMTHNTNLLQNFIRKTQCLFIRSVASFFMILGEIG
jgi:hypothetical protein